MRIQTDTAETPEGYSPELARRRALSQRISFIFGWLPPGDEQTEQARLALTRPGRWGPNGEADRYTLNHWLTPWDAEVEALCTDGGLVPSNHPARRKNPNLNMAFRGRRLVNAPGTYAQQSSAAMLVLRQAAGEFERAEIIYTMSPSLRLDPAKDECLIRIGSGEKSAVASGYMPEAVCTAYLRARDALIPTEHDLLPIRQ